MAAKAYKNPTNGYTERYYPSNAVICTLLFAPIYFAVKGVWTHAVASLILAILTSGVSNIVYCFFAPSIMQNHYLRKGWVADAALQR